MLGTWWLFAACATPAAPPAKAPVVEAKVEPKAVSAPQPAADELYTRLVQQPKAESVLAAVPDDVRAQMDERVAKLSAEDRRALLDPAQPYAYQRPLLHILAGGDSVGSYSTLFSSSAVADELVDARFESGRFDDLPPVVTDVAKRAARYVLARRAADVAPGLPRKKEILGEIAAAAEFLGDDPIYVAALTALEKDFPEQRWGFMRAGALARALQPEQAKLALPKDKEVDAAMMRSAQILIAAAEQALKPTDNLEAAVANARAQLVLDREQGALDTLAPYQAQENVHLALAAVKLRALAGTGPCPAVRTPLGNGVLCRFAWQRFLEGQRLAAIEQAWASGAGRDVEGIDVWLGLSHVVPMMYGLQENAEQALAHLAGLTQGAKAAVSVSPQYAGVELLATTLHQALSAGANEGESRGELPKTARKDLLVRARTLVGQSPNDSWAQAAALGAVAVVAPYEDGRDVLTALNDVVGADWRINHGSLLLWSLLAAGDAQAFIANKGVLGRAAQVSAEGSYERSRWVILWSEAEAHLEPGERSFGIVGELAKRLNNERAPLDLRLRTALDAAGIKARQGDVRAAADLLGPLVADIPRSAVSTREEQDLLVTATGYAHVLRALAEVGESRVQQVNALGELLQSVQRASAAPPAVVRWLGLWKTELDRLALVDACQGNKACETRVKPTPTPSKASLDKELGQQMANLLRRGVLPTGGVELEFRYRSGRLAPQVKVDPAFLLVHMPPSLSTNPKKPNASGSKESVR